jgi:hypothetical protein
MLEAPRCQQYSEFNVFRIHKLKDDNTVGTAEQGDTKVRKKKLAVLRVTVISHVRPEGWPKLLEVHDKLCIFAKTATCKQTSYQTLPRFTTLLLSYNRRSTEFGHGIVLDFPHSGGV